MNGTVHKLRDIVPRHPQLAQAPSPAQSPPNLLDCVLGRWGASCAAERAEFLPGHVVTFGGFWNFSTRMRRCDLVFLVFYLRDLFAGTLLPVWGWVIWFFLPAWFVLPELFPPTWFLRISPPEQGCLRLSYLQSSFRGVSGYLVDTGQRMAQRSPLGDMLSHHSLNRLGMSTGCQKQCKENQHG